MSTDPFLRAFEVAPEAQLLTTPLACVIAASNGYLRATGLTRAEVVGRTLFELPPYRGAPQAGTELEHVLKVLAHSTVPATTHFSDIAPCATGTLFTHASSLPVLNAEGQLTHVVHRLSSNSARHDTESDRERRLRKLIEYSFDAIALIDARMNFTYVTPTIQGIWGYSPADFIVRSPMTDVHPDDVAALGAATQRLLDEPLGVLIQRPRIRHRDGSWRTLELTGVNYLHDPDLNAIVATFRDITERVALTNELRLSRDQLALALSAARAITWDRDLTTQRSHYSTNFADYFGLPASGEAPYEGMDAVHPEDRDAVLRAYAAAQQSGTDFQVEFRGIERSEGVRYYSSRGQFLCDAGGNAIRIIGVTWDASEAQRLRVERALLEQRMQEGQKLESLGVLAGGIAHDFNNLLMVIMGNASLMRVEDGQSSAGLYHLQQIEEASSRASDLCRQMLAYAGKGRFVLARTNLNELIEATTQLLQVSISKKAVLRFHLYGDLPFVVADVTQIRQVLMNLVINASDAIGERSGVISISTGVVRADRSYLDNTLLAPDLAEGDYVYLEVSDTGHGMTTETQTHIFEPFFSTKAPGRGLGLAAVLGIVRGHKGALKLYSEHGRGSSFKFLLPLAGPDAESHAQESRPSSLGAASGTILVVDDEESVCALACQMIEKLGMRTLAAADGLKALDVYRQHSSEITGVLMDLTMPHMDGEEAFRELRRINSNVRVLLMSGYNEQDAISRFVGKGLAGFVQKPFGLDELEKHLSAVLAKP